MSDNITAEPPGEEIVDIGTTLQDASVRIKYKHGRIECTARKGNLDEISILMTVSSASGSTYKIKRKPGGAPSQENMASGISPSEPSPNETELIIPQSTWIYPDLPDIIVNYNSRTKRIKVRNATIEAAIIKSLTGETRQVGLDQNGGLSWKNDAKWKQLLEMVHYKKVDTTREE
ncbi:hypothetical protein P5673_009517 [Acropora cervicornis]|uniref:Uncharacterized protein n=1 Tax=Acropora cervicornis TaxID=6130 RepID=A0AAD9QSZ8_ACRCE|nr:hypothetical protein P5673_009517 [Acropora cervicornis]